MKFKHRLANEGLSVVGRKRQVVDVTLHKAETPIFRRRHPRLAGIALGTAVAVTPILGSAQGVLERAEGMLDQLKADIKGELQDLREDVREEVAYLLGMESWIYGYPLVLMDVSKLLDSANKYVMHYDKGQLSPTNGTWSVSQYQGNFYVPNVLNRYAIAPWMPLKFNADGSLDIYLQAESPGADKETNWLPTPLGEFNITIRNYWPKKEALDGTYKNPPIMRVQ